MWIYSRWSQRHAWGSEMYLPYVPQNCHQNFDVNVYVSVCLSVCLLVPSANIWLVEDGNIILMKILHWVGAGYVSSRPHTLLPHSLRCFSSTTTIQPLSTQSPQHFLFLFKILVHPQNVGRKRDGEALARFRAAYMPRTNSLGWFCQSFSFFFYFHQSIYPFLHPSIRPSVCLFVLLSVFLSVYLSTCMFVYLSIYLYICLSICLSTYPSVCVSIRLSICHKILTLYCTERNTATPFNLMHEGFRSYLV